MSTGAATINEITSVWKFPLIWHCYIDMTEPYHLRISDIRKLKKGDKIEITTFDRNVWDVALDGIEENKAYEAADFFARGYKAVYTHNRGLSGKIRFADIDDSDRPFEWDLEYVRGRWYPLHKGRIEGDEYWTIPDVYKKSWSEYPTDTRVGWRGPCVLTKSLKVMPKIFYVDNDNVLKGVGRQLGSLLA